MIISSKALSTPRKWQTTCMGSRPQVENHWPS